ncbi:hypothetical protein B7494_g2950 [Chlorociboria aeruginascens]|nr:hypothetical protein B7494_g2950 [Chlorociboria aeruginascens]
MADPDVFNSSDIEFDPVPSKSRQYLGQRSIQDIIKHAAEDRLSSKKAIKSLQFGTGAPGTLDIAHRWVNRFNAFRQLTLRQDIGLPFTGDDLLRFFDSIVGKLKSTIRGKPAPSKEVMVGGFGHISAYGTFTYTEASGYKLTARDGSRMNTWLDDAVKSGRLTKGRWKKRVWLNYIIVSRMAKAWIEHFEKYGTRSWDLVIAKLLSIVLVASLGMRAGDVTQSRGYKKSEYLKYKDIKLQIVGNREPKLENIKASITLEYVKCKKDLMNDDHTFYLRPLEDANESHMCIISLILTHAFRHNLVRGTTMQEVLNNAIEAPNSEIVWLYPDRPIITAFERIGYTKIDLEKTAHPDQLLRTIKEMGIISNIISPVTTHALRFGAAQDTAHLTRNAANGFVDDTVRQTIGHSTASMNRGTTEVYAGNPTRETYNDRATAQFSHAWAAKFSETSALGAVKGPVSEDEILQWQTLHEPDATDHDTRNARSRARHAIRVERHANFVASAVPEPGKEKKRVLAEKPSNPMISRPVPMRSASSAKESALPILSQDASGHNPSHGAYTGNIDPRLLDEDYLDNTEVDPVELDTLVSQVMLENTPRNEQIDTDGNGIDMAVLSLLDDHVGTEQKSQAEEGSYDFIARFSRINIVNHITFADAWVHHKKGAVYEDSVGKYSIQGNSRDPPTPMYFFCQKTPHCTFSTLRRRVLVAHEVTCSSEYVAREVYRVDQGENFQCGHCELKFLSQVLLNFHLRSTHNFLPIPCPNGCDPSKIYTSRNTLDLHTRRFHSGIWPARCLYPECDNETKFKSTSYSNHLTRDHNLHTRAARAPFFPATVKQEWKPTLCPDDDCMNHHEFKSKYYLKSHLIKIHKYKEDAADTAAACGYIKKLSNKAQKSSVTRKYPLKPWQVGKSGDVDDVDEDGS